MHFVCLTRITSEHSVKGGMEIHLKVLAEGLAARGHKVTVVTTRGVDGFVGEKEISGVTYVFTDTPWKNSLANWYPLWYKRRSGILEKIHEDYPIDLVWAEGSGAYGAIEVLKELKIPYVPIAQGTIPGDLISYYRQLHTLTGVAKFLVWLLIKSYFWLRYEGKYLNNAAAIVAVSNELKADMMHYYGIDSDDIDVIFNGVPPENFYQDVSLRKKKRQEMGIPEDAFVAVSAGRIIREKGFHFAVEALRPVLAIHPNTYLLVLGKGPYADTLQQLAVALGVEDNVRFMGFIAHDEINAYYNAADCMIAATLRNEGLPLIFCEAMLTGLPIIASAYGGNPSAVKDGETGFLLKQVSVDAVAEAWKKLITDPSLYTMFSTNAQQSAYANFIDSVMTEATEKLFQQILENSR